MISLQRVDEICRLLAKGGLSLRKIAILTGSSRTTVRNVASGRHPALRPHSAGERQIAVPNGPVKRCTKCGAMVHMPCLACHVREVRAETDRSLAQSNDEPLALELQDEDRQRYEDAHRRAVLADLAARGRMGPVPEPRQPSLAARLDRDADKFWDWSEDEEQR